MTKKLWLAVGILIIAGVGYTVWDYQQWKHAEFDLYGQGVATPIPFEPSLPLTQVYSPELGPFRIKFPTGWIVVSNPKNPGFVTAKEPSNKAQIKVTVTKSKMTLADNADREADGVTRDRDYVAVGANTFTILTWERTQTVQKALAMNGDNLMIIEVTCDASLWPVYAQTFDSVYRGVVWF